MKRSFNIILKVALIFVLTLTMCSCGKVATQEEKIENVQMTESEISGDILQEENVSAEEEETLSWGIELPYELEEGRIQVVSIFQSDLPNPDKDLEVCTSLASLEVVNKSEEYLKTAEISIELEDGKKLHFLIQDIPAGRSVWTFDTENTAVEEECKISQITCDAEFVSSAGWEDEFLIEVNGTSVSITNVTQEEKNARKVICHCVLDGVYFGGTSYEYEIQTLAPSETAVIDVKECFFGEAEVVQVIE